MLLCLPVHPLSCKHLRGQEVGCITSDRQIPPSFLNKHFLCGSKEKQEQVLGYMKGRSIEFSWSNLTVICGGIHHWPTGLGLGVTWIIKGLYLQTISLGRFSYPLAHMLNCAARSSYFHSFHLCFCSPWTLPTTPFPGSTVHNQKVPRRPLYRGFKSPGTRFEFRHSNTRVFAFTTPLYQGSPNPGPWTGTCPVRNQAALPEVSSRWDRKLPRYLQPLPNAHITA